MSNNVYFCLLVAFVGTIVSLSWGAASIFTGASLFSVIVYLASFVAQVYLIAAGQDGSLAPSKSKLWEVLRIWGSVNLAILLFIILVFIAMVL